MDWETAPPAAALAREPSRSMRRARAGKAVIGPRGRLAASLAVSTALGLAPSPAAAFELFGWHLWGEKAAEETSPDAQPYTIDIRVKGDDALADTVKGHSGLWTDREAKPPPSTPAFLSRSRAEYGRLLAALRAEGHYGGSIRITVDGRPVEDIAIDATLPKPAPVVVDIDPGPTFIFGSVVIKGRPERDPEADADPRIRTPERLGLEPGKPARADAVTQSEAALVDAWKRLGHPKAKAGERDLVADHKSDRLDVTIAVESGPAAVFGPVTVSGTERMDPDFVARYTGIVPGRFWSPKDVAEAQKRLRRLDVFSSTRLVENETIAPDGSLGLDVQVAERPLNVVGGGLSYSTIDGAGLEGWWLRRNLFGQAESLKLEGKISGIDSVDPANFTYLAAATFTKPGVLSAYTDLTAQVLASREVLDTYTQDTVRLRVGLAHEFFQGLTGKTAANIEFDKVDDAYGKRDLAIASLPSEIAWDTTDDKLGPTTGFRLKGAVEPFHEMRLGNTGAITRIDASAYVPLDADRRWVVAGRLAVGSVFGASADELPPDRLFFAGGGQSVRGYGYRTLGPRLADGTTVGGRSLVEGSLELRAKVTDTIGVVPFVDAGSAFSSTTPDFSQSLKIGAGLGVRYYTGLGAIRVDAAVPVNPDPGDSGFALYIGLGESF